MGNIEHWDFMVNIPKNVTYKEQTWLQSEVSHMFEAITQPNVDGTQIQLKI